MAWKIRQRKPASMEIGALVAVPRELIDDVKAKLDLTVRNETYWKAISRGMKPPEGVPPDLKLFSVCGGHMLLPRHYRIPWVSDERPSMVADLRNVQSVVGPRHTITLRNDAQKAAVGALNASNGDKLLAMGCGKGKTIISLVAASESQKFPALVVVNTKALLNQWRRAIVKAYGISFEKIGVIQGPKATWQGKTISIAIINTLAARHWKREFLRYFRLVIFDEAHMLGARTFSEVCGIFPGERWGLSATMDRSDGMDRVFRLHLGKVILEDLEQEIVPKVIIIRTGVKLANNRFRAHFGRVNLPQVITALSTNERRTEKVLDVVAKAIAAKRKVMVLGERLEELANLYERTQCASKGLVIGGMKEKAETEALSKDCIFAISILAKQALDKEDLDCLLVLYPFADGGRLRQTIGRVLRKKEGKPTPIVIFFEDDVSIMQALMNKVKKHLSRLQYPCIYK